MDHLSLHIRIRGLLSSTEVVHGDVCKSTPPNLRSLQPSSAGQWLHAAFGLVLLPGRDSSSTPLLWGLRECAPPSVARGFQRKTRSSSTGLLGKSYLRGGLIALPYKNKDVANYQTKIYRELSGNDMSKALEYFRNRKAEDPNFFTNLMLMLMMI